MVRKGMGFRRPGLLRKLFPTWGRHSSLPVLRTFQSGVGKQATGKSHEPAGWKACPTIGFVERAPIRKKPGVFLGSGCPLTPALSPDGGEGVVVIASRRACQRRLAGTMKLKRPERGIHSAEASTFHQRSRVFPYQRNRTPFCVFKPPIKTHGSRPANPRFCGMNSALHLHRSRLPSVFTAEAWAQVVSG